jgi:drug/metabolite transporter (DMT)-like permease
VPRTERGVARAARGGAEVIAISTFYTALAIGTMSIVTPISATSALVTFVAGLASGERPGAAQLTGAVVAAAGVLLVAGAPRRDRRHAGPAHWLLATADYDTPSGHGSASARNSSP